MLQPGPQPKRKCRHCLKRVAVRKNGALREHHEPGGVFICAGSGKPSWKTRSDANAAAYARRVERARRARR